MVFRLLLILGIGAIFWAFKAYELGQYLTLEQLKTHQEDLNRLFEIKPIEVIAVYMGIYIASTALSLPGATVLTIAAGVIFGTLRGTLIVSFASTIGATLAFLVSRFLLRDWVQEKFQEKLQVINEGIKKEGAFYLFTLRLIPLFPFFLINLVMGLTPMKTVTFFFVSQAGMLLGTIAYVNAGTELGQIESLRGILSPGLIGSFVLIGVVPLISKGIIEKLKARKAYRGFSKPKRFDYNLVAIGAGSGGLVSAYIAAAVKAKVALIEKHKMGGDCLNTGCVPSKALLKSAKVAYQIKHASQYGIENLPPQLDFAKVMARVQKVIKEIEPHDSVERYSGLGVECLSGEAKLISPWEVQVNGKTLTTKNIIIATGARPLVPPIPGLDQVNFLTSDTVWNLRELPKRMLVMGGGPIGSELAQAFHRLGSEVTQVEMASRIMVREDEDVSQEMESRFKKEGLRVLTSHRVKEFKRENGREWAIAEFNGQDVELEFDVVLLALGRVANTKGFGLEDLGIELEKNGTIRHDEYLRSNFPNIYAVGDVAGPYQFTHTASHQAWFAAVNALFSPIKKFKADYRVIPWCTFTDPEVARVGLNEQEAREKGISYEVTKYGLDDLDRAIADSEAHGFVKVLTVPGKDKILGVTIVGHGAGEIIGEYIAAMKHGFGMNAILGTVHIYPTYLEANKYAAGNWKRAHAPTGVLKWVERFHHWRRG